MDDSAAGTEGTQTDQEGGRGGWANCPYRSTRLFAEEQNATMKTGRVRGDGGKHIIVNYSKRFYPDTAATEVSHIYDDLTPQLQQ